MTTDLEMLSPEQEQQQQANGASSTTETTMTNASLSSSAGVSIKREPESPTAKTLSTPTRLSKRRKVKAERVEDDGTSTDVLSMMVKQEDGESAASSAPVTPLKREQEQVHVKTPVSSAQRRSMRIALAASSSSTDSPSVAVKDENNDDDDDADEKLVSVDDVSIEPRTPSTPSRKKSTGSSGTPIKLSLDKPHPEPARWRRQYTLIESMRSRIVAPVDTLGCETPNRERSQDPRTVRFHMLISLMLSSQTKDPVTSQAVTNLHERLPGGLTAESLAVADPTLVSECINKVGFWRRKTEYITEAAKRIVEGGLDDGEPEEADVEGTSVPLPPPGSEDHTGPDIPRTLGGLCKLKGVGPKMAFLALQCAWNLNSGVGVDVHVHRITNRLGWHKPKTTDPERTRLNLQSWLPPQLFKPINHVLVGFGQVVCLPVGPRCDVCLLGKERICPSRVANVNIKNRKVVEFGFLEKDEQSAAAGGEVKAAVEVEVEDDEQAQEAERAMRVIAKEEGKEVVMVEGKLMGE